MKFGSPQNQRGADFISEIEGLDLCILEILVVLRNIYKFTLIFDISNYICPFCRMLTASLRPYKFCII